MSQRRVFVKAALTATAAAGLGRGGGASPTGPLLPSDAAARTLRLSLMSVGETAPVFDGDRPLAVTRVTESMVVAVSRVCTHQGCTVLLPGAAGTTLDCPCHGSRFTTSGGVVNGPATRSLQTYPARIQGDQVVVTLG